MITIATNAALAPRLAPLARRCAGASVRIDARGSDVAMAALYSGRADVAVLGREASDNEIKAYAWINHQPPAARRLGAGSVATPGLSPDLAVLVNAANPLREIGVERLRALLEARGAPAIWGALGIGGALAGQPIHLVIPDAESGTGRFLRQALHDGQPQFAWARVREVPLADVRVGSDAASDRSIRSAVAADRTAIGFAAAVPDPGVRVLTLRTASGAQVRPGDPEYPLQRKVMAYAHPEADARSGALLACLAKGFALR